MANRTMYTTESYVEAVRKIHGGRFDYSQVVFVSVNTPVTIVCPIHGAFRITAKNALKESSDCPSCRDESTYIYKEAYIASSMAKYGDQFIYTYLPNKFRKTDKLKFICKAHGEYYQAASLHLNAKKHSCRQCMLNSKGTANRTKTQVVKSPSTLTSLPKDLLADAKAVSLVMWKPPR
jgi:hypothetical protein